ncbi:MAG TPA: hypothetical protein VFS27_12770 [Blastocatellia bacterium]|nr:hypothetical protein [Blastocatellia bacterium]
MKLKVIPKPADNTRILVKSNSENSTILFKGEADHDLRCGQCDALLAEKVGEKQFCSPVFLCGNCGSYNDTIRT